MATLKTFSLLAMLTALFVGVGFLIGGQTGLLIAFAVAAVMNFVSYWNADKIVLRMQGPRQLLAFLNCKVNS